MASKKASFQLNWLQESQFSKWLEKVPNDMYSARCKLCLKTFSLSNMGRRAVSSHMNSAKHLKHTHAVNSILPIQAFTTGKSLSSAQCTISELGSAAESSLVNNLTTSTSGQTLELSKPTKLSTLDKFKLKDEVTEAEILWCINTVVQHNSLRNAEQSVLLFTRMFPDSKIAKEMKLHKDKVSYSIVYGLANYFKEELKTLVCANSNYVIGFDESLNKIAEKTQMDLSIRFWDEKTDAVKARYFGSVFLNQAKSIDLLEAFKLGIEGIDPSKILQISMDGPNVNWSFYRMFKNDLISTFGPEIPHLLELGSCGLHVIHGAFKLGMKKTGWKIIEYLRAVYNLFKMVPTRRGQFIEITGCSLFPLPFCTVRWVENVRVAKRCRELMPALNKYVESVSGTDKEPACNSFKVVQSSLRDKLLPAKLAFFQSFAEELEPFLTEFQTDSPMVPFLYESLLLLTKGIMTKFVKKEQVSKENFVKTNVMHKEDGLFKNLLALKEIDLGYGTRSALRHCNDVKEKDLLGFKKEVRSCFQHFIAKIQEKSPLKYPLTKALSFLNPSNVAIDEETTCQNMAQTFDIMVTSKVISPAKAEKADREYRALISKPHFTFECANYNKKNTRLDKFWMTEVGLESAENIKDVIKMLLLLSHGNATLERGFSVNKEIVVENLKEDSLIAQRMVFDAVTSSGGFLEFASKPIPKKMIHSMKNAYSRFKEAEDYRKQTMTEKDKRAAEKRKVIIHVKELQAKKAKLMKDALQEANVLAEEIEKLKKLS